MVYLKNLFVRTSIWTTLAVVVALSFSQDVDAVTMKIAYKKGIVGKSNVIKEKRYNIRSGVIRQMPITSSTSPSTNLHTGANMSTDMSMSTSSSMSTKTNTSMSSPTGTVTLSSINTTMPPSAQVLAPTEDISIEKPTAPLQTEVGNKEHKPISYHNNDSVEADATINTQEIEKIVEDKQIVEEDDALRQYLVLNRLIEGTPVFADSLPDIEPLANNTLAESAQMEETLLSEVITDAEAPPPVKGGLDEEIEELFPLPEPEPLIAPRLLITPTKASNKKINRATTTESNRPVPCTCGVFLTSQFKRGSGEQPQGAPVITNELDRTFQCSSVGQKQCQTKCLETMVQHLPNSASILCATLNRDCRKERAYLFIKNCRNHWVNTNLAAGREYCCRDGKPYKCPLV